MYELVMLAPPRAAILERSYVSHSLGSLVDGKEKMQLSAAASFLITATSRHKRQKNDSISLGIFWWMERERERAAHVIYLRNPHNEAHILRQKREVYNGRKETGSVHKLSPSSIWVVEAC